MEKGHKFKLKLPRIFTSSCKTQHLSEVIDHQNPIFTSQTSLFLQTPLMGVTQNNNISLMEVTQDDDNNNNNPSLSPVIKPKLTPSFSSSSSSMMYCKPRCPETFDHMVRQNCIIATAGNPFPRRKVTGKYSLLSPVSEFSGGGRWCSSETQKKGRTTRKKKNNKNNFKGKNSKNESALLKKIENPDQILYYSSNESSIDDWFSSDGERKMDETDTLFSFKSLSISSDDDDDTGLARARTRARAGRRKPKKEEGRVKDTFAVVKRSSDPYNDFKTSMVEMIIEKQIFGAKELEKLLQCFLSLNSVHHHRVIVQVFTEIWGAIFF